MLFFLDTLKELTACSDRTESDVERLCFRSGASADIFYSCWWQKRDRSTSEEVVETESGRIGAISLCFLLGCQVGSNRFSIDVCCCDD